MLAEEALHFDLVVQHVTQTGRVVPGEPRDDLVEFGLRPRPALNLGITAGTARGNLGTP